jgi:hypothetical protein
VSSCGLTPARLSHKPNSGRDGPVRTGWDRCPAEMPASASLRPTLIAVTIGASLVGSSLVGAGNGFGSLWLASNASLHLLIAAWLLTRPAGATAGMLSAGGLLAFVLVVYGSWAPALAAAEPFSPLVPGEVGKSAMEYTTAAALVVAVGVVLTSSIYAFTRGPGIRVNHRPAVPPNQWWKAVLVMEAIGLFCFAAYKVSSHQPLVSLALFRPLPTGIAQSATPSSYQFLSAGIDVSIGAAIAASGLFWLKTYRLRVLALIVGNLFLYTTIGFKYRIVVTMIGVFAVWAATRPHKGQLVPRSQRTKVVLVAVAMTTLAFFVVQVYRGNHESSRVVTASSFNIGALEGIATSSIDIATPYAAIHQQHFGLLLGESYLQLPALFAPRAITGSKALPAMTSLIQAVTLPGTGAAVPLWAEADANFGLIGLLAFGVILGWVVSRSDTADRRCMEIAAMAAATGAVLASVLSRSLMFFALYEFAAIVLPIWISWQRLAGRTPVFRGAGGEAEMEDDSHGS